MIRYALTIFLGAFLLFQVQPLMGKYILPWFGGTASVWTTCMLFFQMALLGGYAYAHVLSDRLSPRRQGWVHLSWLAASLLLLPLNPSAPADGAETPMLTIVWLLAVNIGVPFVILSATGPLLQSWFRHTHPGHSPYRLYALSNVGSLLALLTFPIVFEPAMTLRTQAWAWSAAYVGFVAACGYTAWRMSRTADWVQAADRPDAPAPAATPAPSLATTGLWLALSAAGSVMLLATTNQMCQDLAVVPFLWVLPLAVYLLSFIICFDHDWWYRRRIFVPLLIGSAALVTVMLHVPLGGMVGQILVYMTVLLACCMTCHGELAHRKPDPRYLTRFYLVIAAGGALGGLLVAMAAPLLLEDYWEYHLGLLATLGLVLGCLVGGPRAFRTGSPRRVPAALACVFLLLVGGAMGRLIIVKRAEVIDYSRNFFGVLRVWDEPGEDVRVMSHGRIVHGAQFLDETLRRTATTYYGPTSGVMTAVATCRKLRAESGRDGGLKIGVVGLGAGSMAAITEPGDTMRFYEINPEVERLARKHFTYLADARGATEVVLGDARIELERETQAGMLHQFDVLAIDAFNGDAIPMHLLTREAFRVYWRHLRPDGLLVLHISNRYVDLEPVVRGLAADAGHRLVHLVTHRNRALTRESASDWIVVTSNRRFIDDRDIRIAASPASPEAPDPLVWTDDFASLWSVLRSSDRPDKWLEAPNDGLFVSDHAGLLTAADELRLTRTCQGLYHDTDGRCAMLVLTIASLAEAEAPSMPALADRVLARLAMTANGTRLGLLVVSRDDRRMALRLDPRFDADDALTEEIVAAVGAGLRRDDRSAGFLAGLGPLESFLRSADPDGAARITVVDDAESRP